MRKLFVNTFKKGLTCLLILLIVYFISSPITHALSVSGNHNYVERTEDGIKINGGTYRVTETLATEELYFGVKYKNDAIMVSTTLQERMTEYALGSASYGTVPFVMNQEYSGSAHVLEIPIDTGVEIIPWQVVTDGVWKLANIKTIAQNFEESHPEYRVIAAINGSFFDINSVHDYVHTAGGSCTCFGENYKLLGNTNQLGFTNDGSIKSIVEQDSTDKSATPVLSIYDKDENIIKNISIDKTNDEPGENETSIYYGTYDKEHQYHSIDVTDAYLVCDKEAYTIAYSSSSFYGKGKITTIGNATLEVNQFAIKTTNQEIKNALTIGTTIRVQYESENIRNGADNSLYYKDKLVNNGEECDTIANAGVLAEYSTSRYPRTLLGRKADGTIVMTCTDGRQADKGYYGMNGTESAAQMIYYGCEEAWCFDGGGSTCMCILKDGELQYVNSPSDGHPRSDGNAMLVVVKVPTIEIESSFTKNSISLKINVTDENKTKELYVKCNEEMLKVTENGEVYFKNLNSYTSYVYELYTKNNNDYIRIPYGGNVLTAKEMISFNGLSIKKDGDNYLISYDLIDTNKAAGSIILLVNGKRIKAKNNQFTVPCSYGGPLTSESKFIVAYDLCDKSEQKNVQTIEYVPKGVAEESSIIFDSVLSELDNMINKISK